MLGRVFDSLRDAPIDVPLPPEPARIARADVAAANQDAEDAIVAALLSA